MLASDELTQPVRGAFPIVGTGGEERAGDDDAWRLMILTRKNRCVRALDSEATRRELALLNFASPPLTHLFMRFQYLDERCWTLHAAPLSDR